MIRQFGYLIHLHIMCYWLCFIYINFTIIISYTKNFIFIFPKKGSSLNRERLCPYFMYSIYFFLTWFTLIYKSYTIGILSSSFLAIPNDKFVIKTFDLDIIFILEQHTTIIPLCGITWKFL